MPSRTAPKRLLIGPAGRLWQRISQDGRVAWEKHLGPRGSFVNDTPWDVGEDLRKALDGEDPS